MQGVDRGLAKAAKDRGLEYRVALAKNDPAKMIEQVQFFLRLKSRRGGGCSCGPCIPRPQPATNHLGRRLCRRSRSTPATSLLNAPQYLTGKALGDAAAAYIKGRLKGKANVVLLTHDSLQFLAPRFVAMRDALQDLPGATIVADISPVTVNKEGGEAMMRTILWRIQRST